MRVPLIMIHIVIKSQI